MWLGPQRGTFLFWIVVSLTTTVVKSQRCPDGMYWCQDRCGTEADTCCQTPDGQHNLCGIGTICCGFGCCPDSSYTCNPDFSCTGPDGTIISPAPNPNSSSHPGETAKTSSPPPVPEETSGGASSPPSPTGPVVVVGTETATLPVVTSSTTLVSLDHTFTLAPPANTFPGRASPTLVIVGTETAILHPVTVTTTLVSLGSTFTLTPPATMMQSPGRDPETPVVIIDGTNTHSLPAVTQETTLTTAGQTVTLIPDGPPTITITGDQEQQPPPQPPPTETATQTSATTTSVEVIDGTKTFTLPPVSQETTLTTAGRTITLLPDGPPTITITGSQQPPPPPPPSSPGTMTTTTQETTTASPVVVVGGSQTFTFPPVSQKTTVTTEGLTITLRPGGGSTTTITPPSSQEPTATETPDDNPPSTPRPPSSQEPTPTETPDETGDDEDDNPPSTHTRWPPEAVITPIEIEVDKPKPREDNDDDDDDDDDDNGAIIPCDMWFFSICIKFDSINILGWEIILPPGIYPPGPPPSQNIKLPPSIEIHGELPPWPKFTVGPNRVPTFPPEPESTKCETKTASLCSASTSYVVSTVDGAEEAVSSTVSPSTCAKVQGCLITDSTQEATATKTDECKTATVTDVVVTCSGSETTACATKTKIPQTGCSVTATTTTATCTPAPTGDGNTRRQGGDNMCVVSEPYIIWPRDGSKLDETSAILTEMQNLLQDDSKIKVSDTKMLGVNFWRVSLEPDQVQKFRDIPNVVTVYRECTWDCMDPLTLDTPWRYQTDYIDELIDGDEGRQQMVYLSNKKELMTEKFKNHYFFDESAGEDVVVYIVDSGAQLDHAEFTQGDNVASKAEFKFVRPDYDGGYHKDDSGLPLGGRCRPGTRCNPHGTSMLDLVAGAKLGISKKVKPVLVRVPRMKEEGRGASPEDYLNGIGVVADAITGSADESVKRDFDLWKSQLYDLLKGLIQKGVFVVTGSGNSAAVTAWPALFGAEPATVEPERRGGWPHLPELLVVGAADVTTGLRWWKSGIDMKKQLPHVYAPGDHILTAEGDKAKWTNNDPATYRSSQGTSMATAYTAGLAAYFLKVDQVGRLGPDAKGSPPDMSPAGLKRYIINNAWSRATDPYVGDILGIWNGAAIQSLELHGVCPYEPSNPPPRPRLRRQENNGDDLLTGQCVSGSSTPSPTGKPTSEPPKTTTDPTTLQTTTKDPEPTGLDCTEDTVDQCGPALICAGPRRYGCEDGKCVCLEPDPPLPEPTSEAPESTGLECTEDTVNQCGPALICAGPRRYGCVDGKCVCLELDPPLPEPTSKEPEPTSKEPEPTSKEPEPTSEPEPPTKTPLNFGSQHCNDADDFPDHDDVRKFDVQWASGWYCEGDKRMMGPGDVWEKDMMNGWYGSDLHFHVEWMEFEDGDCVTDVDEQDMKNPLGTGDMDTCPGLFYENWRNCNNDGVGGWRRAGCLKYYLGIAD